MVGSMQRPRGIGGDVLLARMNGFVAFCAGLLPCEFLFWFALSEELRNCFGFFLLAVLAVSRELCGFVCAVRV